MSSPGLVDEYTVCLVTDGGLAAVKEMTRHSWKVYCSLGSDAVLLADSSSGYELGPFSDSEGGRFSCGGRVDSVNHLLDVGRDGHVACTARSWCSERGRRHE